MQLFHIISAYRAPIFSPNRQFTRFEVEVKKQQELSGYWRFSSEGKKEDDYRAYTRGYNSPEQVILAELRGESNDDIRITWVPGSSDPFQCLREDTAKRHVKAIFKEWEMLGRLDAWCGQLPLYYPDPEQKLLGWRQQLYKQQTAVASQAAPAKASSSIPKAPQTTSTFSGPPDVNVWSAGQATGQEHDSVPASASRNVSGNLPGIDGLSGRGPHSQRNYDQLPRERAVTQPIQASSRGLAATNNYNIADAATNIIAPLTDCGFISVPVTFAPAQAPVSQPYQPNKPQLPGQQSPDIALSEGARKRKPLDIGTEQSKRPRTHNTLAVSPEAMLRRPTLSSYTVPGVQPPRHGRNQARQNANLRNGGSTPAIDPSKRNVGPFTGMDCPLPTTPTPKPQSDRPLSVPQQGQGGLLAPGNMRRKTGHQEDQKNATRLKMQPTGIGLARSDNAGKAIKAIRTTTSTTTRYSNPCFQGGLVNGPFDTSTASSPPAHASHQSPSPLEPSEARSTAQSVGQLLSSMCSTNVPVSTGVYASPYSASSGSPGGNSSGPSIPSSTSPKISQSLASSSSYTNSGRLGPSQHSLLLNDERSKNKGNTNKQNGSMIIEPLGVPPARSVSTKEAPSSRPSSSSAAQSPTLRKEVEPGRIKTKVSMNSEGVSFGGGSGSPSVDTKLFTIEHDLEDPFYTDVLPLSESYPCMDCGATMEHKSDCHIANIKYMRELNVLQLRNLAGWTDKFDPENARTHLGHPPTPPLEDYATKVSGMAEIIRNESSYKNDPDLQGLPDEALLFLWALKTSSQIDCHVVRSATIESSDNSKSHTAAPSENTREDDPLEQTKEVGGLDPNSS